MGVLLAFATSGCVAAGLAAGPLMSAVQLIGDRSVERTVGADLAEAQGATEAVLVRTGFRIDTRERKDDSRVMLAVADDVTVHAKLERVTPKLTRVAVRVERGSVIPDRNTSTQIQDQIAALLAPTPAPPPGGEHAAADALVTLQAEIRKLSSNIDARRAAEPAPAAREDAASIRIEPGAVVTVPMSAALPTVGGPSPIVSVAKPLTAPPTAMIESTTSQPESGHRTYGAVTSTPLHPAGALTPIQAAIGVEARN